MTTHSATVVGGRVAPLRAIRRRLELLRTRRAADRELVVRAVEPSRLSWRVAELTSRNTRLSLARAFRRTVDDANPKYLPCASPLNRGAVRSNADRFEAVARRLEALDHPVRARGVLLGERLLVDGSSVLYDPARGAFLADVLDGVLDALEGTS
jgi:hypothetical protein